MNYVIVGACAAGLAAAEAVRKADAKGNITMLTEEAYFPYSRPSISYFLKGKVKESDMALRKPSFYKTNNINVITNAKVTSIDRKNKTVKVGKKSYPYDKLCLATGSKPFVPPMENVEGKENAVTFLDLASAKELKSLANENTKALSKAINVTSEDVKTLKKLLAKNIEIDIQQVPTEAITHVDEKLLES